MSPGASIEALTRSLCAFPTGVVAPANAALFARLRAEIPLALHRFASGSEHNGWLVPDEWSVERALVTRDGLPVADCAAHPLGVAAYSTSFTGELPLDELLAHVVSRPDLPAAIPYHCMWQYRPWDADWALCVPHAQVATWRPGTYRVDLVTRRQPGEMLVAVADKRGTSDRTIVLNAHTCHPVMANDDMAGVAVLVRLFQRLLERETFYSYRLVLGPEHLGTIFYLAGLSREARERLVCGLFLDMPGTDGPLTIASTFLGGQPLDLALANAARHGAAAFRPVPWRQGAGNDETVWEAPGYEVPFAEVSRARSLFEPFREYHTSLDTPDLMDEGQLAETLLVLEAALDALERDAVPMRRFDGLPCLSSPRYRLYRERPDPSVDKGLVEDDEAWGVLADSLPRYLDGSLSLLEIAERHGLPFAAVRRELERWEERRLVDLVPRVVERLPVTLAAEDWEEAVRGG